MSESKTPKPIPIGTPAVLVAVVAAVVGAGGLAPTAAGWVRAARTPPTNNLSGMSRILPRPVPSENTVVTVDMADPVLRTVSTS